MKTQQEQSPREWSRSILIHSSNVPLWDKKVERAGLQHRVESTDPKRGVTYTIYTTDKDALVQFCTKNDIA